MGATQLHTGVPGHTCFGSKKKGRPRKIYSGEIRLKAAKWCEEEGFDPKDVAAEIGCSPTTLSKWIGLYRRFGEVGLENGAMSSNLAKSPSKKPHAAKAKAVELKQTASNAIQR